MAQQWEALSYIHNVDWRGKRATLSRVRELLGRMGDPQRRLRFVHIAGTNGKGSTAAITASILQAAGYRTGLFTSPYLTRFSERMRVNGEEITPGELEEITAFVRPHAEAMDDHPSEFDLVTCIGMEFFARRGCDIVVLEVGMGGRLDSTNVIDPPEVAVITAIGLDHMQYLGDTVEKIAAEKAGIIKRGSAAVVAAQQQSIIDVIAARCAQEEVPLTVADPAQLFSDCRTTLDGERFCYRGKEMLLSLIGVHQRQNAAAAVETAQRLAARGWKISPEAIQKGLQSARWAGRFELMQREPVFIVDGGHNPQCIQALVKNIQDYLPGRPLTILTGVLADKDYNCMYRNVEPYAKEFITITPGNPRALNAHDLSVPVRQARHGLRPGRRRRPPGRRARRQRRRCALLRLPLHDRRDRSRTCTTVNNAALTLRARAAGNREA